MFEASAVSTNDLMVETQLRNLRGTWLETKHPIKAAKKAQKLHRIHKRHLDISALMACNGTYRTQYGKPEILKSSDGVDEHNKHRTVIPR